MRHQICLTYVIIRRRNSITKLREERLSFSTSIPENSDESTRSGTSDDGAIVDTAEFAVLSVIAVCLGR